MTKELKIKSVAVIGGGPAGLAVANALSQEPNLPFDNVDLFERSGSFGGLWNYNKNKVDNEKNFFSPMYNHLETNITKYMMAYNNFPLPNSCDMFPKRQEILKYIQNYSNSINKRNNQLQFHLNSNVISIIKDRRLNKWFVKYQNLKNNQVAIKNYDAIVIANGHYNKPFIPRVLGLEDWKFYDPKSVIHSKGFNDSIDFKDKKVLIIGNSASGIDISTQLSTTAKSIYLSVKKNAENDIINQNKFIKCISQVKKYDYLNNRSVITIDNKKVESIDTIIFCTGYLYDFPFLKSYVDKVSNDGLKYLEPLITDGKMVHRLYKHMFYIYDPTLSFVALPKNIIPMSFSESQAAIISRVLSGRLKLPTESQMIQEDNQLIQQKGVGKLYHDLKFPLDLNYCKALQRIIDEQGLNSGFQAERWDDQRYKLRLHSSKIKKKRFGELIEYVGKLRENNQPFKLMRKETRYYYPNCRASKL
ncbi:FAD/NAD(P)-binding domain-containing protein [Ascoidea rubescens DSM 1968]|uniref:FAD/NAD(P)-binding domain-containing protein n=1 Tax=Ascoidea rubescens DSM 1968 TaxID=1344418 RepID=A0A1D2VMW5_9ASCO|nr:FAD/NAD(P)-binding domain-containing protein [Ascoidea rubescens DSM 1968]ODV62907.1 FAD/NAD(P)-binding domain-containing protein [Ascoidea rubescens DSM 1968]